MSLPPFDRQVAFHDGRVPVSQLAGAPAIDQLALTFLPTGRDLAEMNETLLPRHPDLELRLYRLPKASDVSALAALSKLKRLSLDTAVGSIDFVASLPRLECLHALLARRLEFGASGWPNSLRHLSLIAPEFGDVRLPSRLRSFSVAARLDDLELLKHCPELASLSLEGRTTRDLSALVDCQRLVHVRVNGQREVSQRHLAPLAKMPALAFLQLHYLAQIEDLDWLGSGPRHLELVILKGLRRIDWPGLARAESLALIPPPGKLSHLDLRPVAKATGLERVTFPPILRKATGGAEALAALGSRNLGIDDFRRAVAAWLMLDSPFL
jgi:hypothetical protein